MPRLLLKNRAQVKLFESIAVLVVFIILLSIGLRFYSGIQEQSIAQARDKFEQLDSVKLSLIISNLPELQCTRRDIRTFTCFDKQKVDTFIEEWQKAENRQHYIGLFDFAEIWIEPVYPPFANAHNSITMYNFTPPSSASIRGSSLTTHPFVLYDSQASASQIQNTFAVLHVRKFAVGGPQQ